jgi:predicted HicB family RNase H-like nuclease
MLRHIMAKKKKDDRSGDRHLARQIGFRPDPETLERLEAMARAEKRSLSNLVNVLIEEALAARAAARN